MDFISSMGTALLNMAGSLLGFGYSGWSTCVELGEKYLSKNPRNGFGGGWSAVTSPAGVYGIMETLAASLLVLYFVLGWLNESIDIRNNFTLENMFRFFVRFAIAGTMVTSATSFASGISDISVAVVTQCAQVQVQETEPQEVFASVKTAVEDEGDDGGGTLLACGLICLIGSLFGMVIIIVCGINILITVLSRTFRLLLCIPFAPVAFAGFAGGHEFSQMGIAWLKAFTGYAFEAVVIAVSIYLSMNMFGDLSILKALTNDHTLNYYIGYALLTVVNCCIPMIACSACVKGAENVVRRCLGLG